MNELQHNVKTFIDENSPCDTHIALVMEVKSRYWKDKNDEVYQSFKNNPVEFTHLYEQMSDKDLGVTDESILETTKAVFDEELEAKAKRYAEFFEEIKKEGDPLFTFLMLLAFTEQKFMWNYKKESSE